MCTRCGVVMTSRHSAKMSRHPDVVYTVTGGIPVKNYRAVIELTDNAVGTHISWTADWDATLLGKLVHKKLQAVYTEIMECLVRAADAKVSA